MDKDDIVYFLGSILIFLLPAIPGVLLWVLLAPETFWQRLATLCFCTIVYFVILYTVLKLIQEA